MTDGDGHGVEEGVLLTFTCDPSSLCPLSCLSWIWVFGARYRHIVRSWASSLGGPSERTYNWSGLALGAFYTAVRRALIVAIALRALGALGMATLAVWLGRRRVIRARRGLPGLGLDEVLRG